MRSDGIELATPQQLLDQIHESGIFSLDGKTLTAAVDRAAQAKEIRPQLLQIRERARIALQHTAPTRDRLPFELIDDATRQLEVALRAFVSDADARIPRYGTVFFEKEGRWHIGSPSQAEDWTLQQQAQAIAQKIETLETRLSDTRSKLKTTQRDLYRHDEAGRGIRPGVAGALLIIAGVILFVVTRTTLALGAAGLGLLLLGMGVALFVRWRRRQQQLQSRFDNLRQRGREQVQQQQKLQAQQTKIAARRDQLQIA